MNTPIPGLRTPRLWALAALLSLLSCAVAGGAAAAEGAGGLELKVITVSEPSLYGNMTLILGPKEAALIDVPFTRSDAHRVVADILETGRHLKYVYITHDHPDHYLSLEVIAEAFPDAQLISAPTVVADIWRSLPIKLKRWGPMLGANGPRRPVVPVAWEQPTFAVDGQEVRILGPMQGDHIHATAVYVPSLKALIAGDLVFSNLYPWLGEHTPERRRAWIHALDELAALKPAVVVAGHQLPGDPQSPAALAFTKDYIVTFDRLAGECKTSAAMAAKLKAAFPAAKDVLGGFLLGNSTKVAVGEMPVWDE